MHGDLGSLPGDLTVGRHNKDGEAGQGKPSIRSRKIELRTADCLDGWSKRISLRVMGRGLKETMDFASGRNPVSHLSHCS